MLISNNEEDVLLVLLSKTLYGLEISKAITKKRQQLGNRSKFSPGTLYPTLNELMKKGLIKEVDTTLKHSTKGGAHRKYYQITFKGAEALVRKNDYSHS